MSALPKWDQHAALEAAIDACGDVSGLLFRLERQCDLNADSTVGDDYQFHYWCEMVRLIRDFRRVLPQRPK